MNRYPSVICCGRIVRRLTFVSNEVAEPVTGFVARGETKTTKATTTWGAGSLNSLKSYNVVAYGYMLAWREDLVM